MTKKPPAGGKAKAGKRRKPKDLYMGSGAFCKVTWSSYWQEKFAFIDSRPFGRKDCRKLSAWLIRAADYLEEQEGK